MYLRVSIFLMRLQNNHISKLLIRTVVVISMVLSSASLFAQGMGPGNGMGQPMVAEFEAAAPDIGEALHDITIYNDLGIPVNVRDLASGKYKVIVLGCLT